MKLTLKTTSGRTAVKLVTDIQEAHSLQKGDLVTAGKRMRESVVETTRAGRDVNDVPFEAYSLIPVTVNGKKYRNYTSAKAAYGHMNVDLTGVGNNRRMLDSIGILVDGTAANERTKEPGTKLALVIDDPAVVVRARVHNQGESPTPRRRFLGAGKRLKAIALEVLERQLKLRTKNAARGVTNG